MKKGAGVKWLVENHLEKIRADYVINEGGGFSFPMKSKYVFTVQTAEKEVMWMKIRAGGSPGYGSILGVADNAVLRMAEVARGSGHTGQRSKSCP